MTVKEIVQANQEAALACKTPEEIRAFVERIGCATQHRWKKAVEAIVEIGGLDYYQAKAEQQKKDEERIKSLPTEGSELRIERKCRMNHPLKNLGTNLSKKKKS
jgi:hypothetical protein